MVKIGKYNIDKKKGVMIGGGVAIAVVIGGVAYYLYDQQKKAQAAVQTAAQTEPAAVSGGEIPATGGGETGGEAAPSQGVITAIAIDSTGKAVQGVKFSFSGIYSATTQSDGVATFLGMPAGSYNLVVTYNGKEYYNESVMVAQNEIKTIQKNITVEAAAPSGAPSAPTNFAATAGAAGAGGSKFVTYTWTDPSTPGDSAITSYKVYRKGALPNNQTANQFVRSGAGEAYNPDVYSIYVTAINANGKESPPSNTVTLDTTGTTTPPSDQGNTTPANETEFNDSTQLWVSSFVVTDLGNHKIQYKFCSKPVTPDDTTLIFDFGDGQTGKWEHLKSNQCQGYVGDMLTHQYSSGGEKTIKVILPDGRYIKSTITIQ